jgi:hypothetical protein
MDGRSNPAEVAKEKEVALTRRILLVLAVGAIIVLSNVSYAFAYAHPNNQGNGSSAPRPSKAEANCDNNRAKQDAKGVIAGGGPKEGQKGPLNCDHAFNR